MLRAWWRRWNGEREFLNTLDARAQSMAELLWLCGHLQARSDIPFAKAAIHDAMVLVLRDLGLVSVAAERLKAEEQDAQKERA